MQIIKAERGRLDVSEKEDYSYCLTRTIHKHEPEEMRLYRATYSLSCGVRQVYVIAESPEGACSQAGCVLYRFLNLQDIKGRPAIVADCVERVPFGIRGWSDIQF